MLLILIVSGCNGDDDDCVQVDTACAPLYTPTFDELHSQTLITSCALVGTSCHSSQGAQAGLVLEDIDTAYDELLGIGDRPRVVPNDPFCSLVSKRLFSTSNAEVMPPGAPLSEAERCVFVRWIDDGAQR